MSITSQANRVKDKIRIKHILSSLIILYDNTLWVYRITRNIKGNKIKQSVTTNIPHYTNNNCLTKLLQNMKPFS